MNEVRLTSGCDGGLLARGTSAALFLPIRRVACHPASKNPS
jgi:hypothetical protein